MKRLLPLTLVVALVAAACGGDDDDAVSAAPVVVENVDDDAEPTPDTDTDTDTDADTDAEADAGSGAAAASSSDEELALEFADCMRSEGFDMNDPTIEADGTINLLQAFQGDGGGPVDQEAAQAAFAECGEILDGTSLLPTPTDITENEAAFLEFAQCLRDQGLDVDDPDLSNIGNGAAGGIFGDSFDPQDPANQPAIEACQSLLAGAFGG